MSQPRISLSLSLDVTFWSTLLFFKDIYETTNFDETPTVNLSKKQYHNCWLFQTLQLKILSSLIQGYIILSDKLIGVLSKNSSNPEREASWM